MVCRLVDVRVDERFDSPEDTAGLADEVGVAVFVCGKEMDSPVEIRTGGGGIKTAELLFAGAEGIRMCVGGRRTSEGVAVPCKSVVDAGSLSEGTDEMIITLLVTVGGMKLLVTEVGDTVGGKKLLVSELSEFRRLVGGRGLVVGERAEVKLPGADEMMEIRDVGKTRLIFLVFMLTGPVLLEAHCEVWVTTGVTGVLRVV